MLTSDAHIVDQAGFRQLSTLEAVAELTAHVNPSIIILWKALLALLKSPHCLQQGGYQLPLLLDGSEFSRAGFL
jgi:hypothetical protein